MTIFKAPSASMSGHGAPPPNPPGGGDGRHGGSGSGGHGSSMLPPGMPPGMALNTDPFGLSLAALPFDQLTAALQLQLQHAQQQQQLALQQQQQQPVQPPPALLVFDQQSMLRAAAQAAAAQQAAAQQAAAAAEQQQQQQQLQLLHQVQQQQHQQQQQQQAAVAANAAAAQAQPAAADATAPRPHPLDLPPEARQQLLKPLQAELATLRRDRPRPRASKEEYIGVACHICGAPADGMHYGAISCRSCNAFFRRAVSYEHVYVCRFGGACDVSVQVDEQGRIVDESVRCACRACRYRLCEKAGMRKTAVQPPRDPTGSQKEKKAVKPGGTPGGPGQRKDRAISAGSGGRTAPHTPIDRKTPRELVREQQLRDGAGPSSRPDTAAGFSDDEDYDEGDERQPRVSPSSSEQAVKSALRRIGAYDVKMEIDESAVDDAILAMVEDEGDERGDEERDEEMMEEAETRLAPAGSGMRLPEVHLASHNKRRRSTTDVPINRPWELEQRVGFDDYEKFSRLTFCYREHHRLMQLAMTHIDNFLDQSETGITLREMIPADVQLLSTTELSGLLYWIEKMEPYTELCSGDRKSLFKRYSVRKLSLDHFFIASQWTEECAKNNFVMLNNTIVPPHKTGFELESDDVRQITAKAEIFLPTFERMWRCVIRPFNVMKITDAEMVFLHTLLLWSPLNNSHVLESTKEIMRKRREWAVRMLFQHYRVINQPQPEVRFGEVAALLSEIEVICDKHCQDFQVAKLFEFCDMSQYWYEKWCYSATGTALRVRRALARVTGADEDAAAVAHAVADSDNNDDVSGLNLPSTSTFKGYPCHFLCQCWMLKHRPSVNTMQIPDPRPEGEAAEQQAAQQQQNTALALQPIQNAVMMQQPPLTAHPQPQRARVASVITAGQEEPQQQSEMTVDDMFAMREAQLKRLMIAEGGPSSSGSIEDPTTGSSGSPADGEYTAPPAKRAAYHRTPSAPSTTPSTPGKMTGAPPPYY